jgi:phosphoglycerate kinase
LLAEIEALQRLFESPREGYVAILGGAKVSDKISVLEQLVPRIETLLIGGGMANTFLLEQRIEVGKSLVETDALGDARRVRDLATQSGTRVRLPVDTVVAPDIDSLETQTVSVSEVTPAQAIFDIGPLTIADFGQRIQAAKTIFWNGPMGVFERPPFANGTTEIARAVAESDAFSVIGGGDSVAAVEAAGLAGKISHNTTGGGASLEFVQGRTLPGIEALRGHQ